MIESNENTQKNSKKTTVAISTLVGWFNNGNRLQNYALQHFLSNNFNVEVKTLMYPTYLLVNKENSLAHRIVRFIKVCKLPKSRVKYKKFKNFDKVVNYDTTLYTRKNVYSLNEKYDYIISGSDQVWNSGFRLNSFLLKHIDKDKRISYAASACKSELNLSEICSYKKNLDYFKGISVREKQATDLLQPLTKEKVNWNIDPTFLVSSAHWKTLEKKPKGINKSKDYLFLCMLGETSSEYKNFIKEIAKENNLKIVDINNKKSKFFTTSPDEFLYLVDNAKVVLTDSFHAIVFSIIFKTPFVHLARIDNVLGDMSMRIKSLELLFNTKFRTLDNFSKNNKKELFSFPIKNSEEIIEKEKQKSIDYFKNCFKNKDRQNNLNDKDFDCSGCGLCANICPVKAIKYETNDKGFIRPVIDQKKCIHCGLCSKNCTVMHQYEKENFDNGLYALKRKIANTNDKSSTTGLFAKLASEVLLHNGVVFGAKYEKNKNEFVKITKQEDLKLIQGSKYYQFDITKSYEEIEKELKTNKQVLVCATPCQIAGLYAKFKGYENLTLVQVICHGVPSFTLFKRYCKETYNKMPDDVNFKKNTPAWDNYSVAYTFEDNQIQELSSKEGWLRLYLSNYALNDCCYYCNYAGRKTGADLTIGDCWGIKRINRMFYSSDGVSLVAVNTNKGNNLLKKVISDFNYMKIKKNKYSSCNVNLFDGTEYHPEKIYKQYEFYDRIKSQGISETYNQMQGVENEQKKKRTFLQRVKNKIKRIIRY